MKNVSVVALELGLTVTAAAMLICLAGFGSRADTQVMDKIKVEVTGILHTGIAAIGGETTGVVIQSGNVTWELDFSGNPSLKTLARELDTKRAVVTGIYHRVAGVEIAQREIVTVASLSPAQ